MITNILLLAIFLAIIAMTITVNRLVKLFSSAEEILRVIYTIVQEIRRNDE